MFSKNFMAKAWFYGALFAVCLAACLAIGFVVYKCVENHAQVQMVKIATPGDYVNVDFNPHDDTTVMKKAKFEGWIDDCKLYSIGQSYFAVCDY